MPNKQLKRVKLTLAAEIKFNPDKPRSVEIEEVCDFFRNTESKVKAIEAHGH